MLCENCGTRVNDIDTHCPNCGMEIIRIDNGKRNSNKYDNSFNTSNTSNNKKQIISAFIALFIFVAAVSIVFSLISQDKKTSNELTNTNITSELHENNQLENNSQDTNLEIDDDEESNSDSYFGDSENNITEHTEIKTTESDFYLPFNTYSIEKLSVSEISVDKILSNSTVVGKASEIIYNGNIVSEGQVDEYLYSVPIDGRLRIDLSEVTNNVKMDLSVINSLGETIAEDEFCYNGEGLTLKALKAGEIYTIRVAHSSGFSAYKLSLYEQKQTIDVSEYTDVEDSIEFTGQRNVYSFTTGNSGRYRFEVSEVKNNVCFEMLVLDHLGNAVAKDEFCYNGEGLTLKGLEANVEYEVQIRHCKGYSGYILNIGHQKDEINVSSFSIVNDSIQHVDQRNVYWFTVPISGRYRFELKGVKSGMKTHLIILDDLGKTVAEDEYCYNGEGITLKGLEEGDIYEVQVRYSSGKGDYTLSIGKQKEGVNIELPSKITDSIEFVDQRNVYYLNSETARDINIKIEDLPSNVCVQVYVFNELGETIISDDYFYNNEEMNFTIAANDKHNIQIRYSKGYSSYSLMIS